MRCALQQMVGLAIVLGLANGCSNGPIAPSSTGSPATAFAEAALSPDANNNVNDGTSFGCGLQSFVPSRPVVGAIDLLLRAGGSFPAAGTTETIHLREDTPTGTIVASASTFVGGPLATGAQVTVRFDFGPPPVHVKAGDTYVIQWISPAGGSAVLTWMGNQSNTYAGGQMFNCLGVAIPGFDLTFATYKLGH